MHHAIQDGRTGLKSSFLRRHLSCCYSRRHEIHVTEHQAVVLIIG